MEPRVEGFRPEGGNKPENITSRYYRAKQELSEELDVGTIEEFIKVLAEVISKAGTQRQEAIQVYWVLLDGLQEWEKKSPLTARALEIERIGEMIKFKEKEKAVLASQEKIVRTMIGKIDSGEVHSVKDWRRFCKEALSVEKEIFGFFKEIFLAPQGEPQDIEEINVSLRKAVSVKDVLREEEEILRDRDKERREAA